MTVSSVPLNRSVFSKAAQGCDIKYNMCCTSFHSSGHRLFMTYMCGRVTFKVWRPILAFDFKKMNLRMMPFMMD